MVGTIQSRVFRAGFALPTILIASVVMMTVLLAALQASVSVGLSLQNQYQQQLLTTTAESGMSYALACLDYNVGATWSQPLKTNTNCAGAESPSCPVGATDVKCSVLNTSQIRTRFEVATPVVTGQTMKMEVTSYVDLKRTDGTILKTVSSSRFFAITQTRDLAGERASQRYWYVGRSGSVKLDFGVSGTSGPVNTAYPSGPSFGEGLTVITDSEGNLLFTTNGITASDATNKVMPGSSAGLGASGSTAQGVVAFPISGNRYMVIGNSAGVDGNDPANPGSYGVLKKSIINMDLTGSNGSAGDVEAGSIQSLTRASLNVIAGASNAISNEPNGTENYTGQYITAAPEANGQGYWVVWATPGRPYFYAMLFNNSGGIVKIVRSGTPDGGPVPVCKWAANNAWRASFGMMRFNTAYDKIVIKNGTTGCESTDSTRRMPSSYANTRRNVGFIYLRSFNNTTGVLGNVYSQLGNQQWYGGYSCLNVAYGNTGYSIDFSPDENYVYETTIYPGRLYRFRITGADISGGTNIATTEQFIGNTDAYPSGTLNGGQVRRAPNGKMYVALQNSPNISVHNFPNNPGVSAFSTNCSVNAAQFSYNTFVLGGSIQSGLGLPDYSTHYVPRRILY